MAEVTEPRRRRIGMGGTKKYRLEFYAQAFNLLNHANLGVIFRSSNFAILRSGNLGAITTPHGTRDEIQFLTTDYAENLFNLE